MKSPLAESLNLKLSGVNPRARLVAWIVCAMELDHARRELGYWGSGSWQQYRAETLAGERESWSSFVNRFAGCDEKTASNYEKCRRVVLKRLQETADFGQKAEALALLAARPSEMTEAERARVIGIISGLLIAGDSLSSLRREYRLRNLQQVAANTSETVPRLPSCPGMAPEGSSPMMEMADRLPGIVEEMDQGAREIAAMALAMGMSADEAAMMARMILLHPRGLFFTA